MSQKRYVIAFARTVSMGLVLGASFWPMRTVAAQGAPGCGTPDPSSAADDSMLVSVLRRRDYLELGRRLRTGAVSGTRERDLLTGILASHRNQHAEAVGLLRSLADEPWTGQPYLRFAAQAALAQSYEKSFLYGSAATEYSRIELDSSALSAAEIRGSVDSRNVMELLRDAAQQLVVAPEHLRIQSRRNQLGLIEVSVRGAGRTDPWIFDTGASISTVTETMARRLGAHLSSGLAATEGIGGQAVPLRVAVIPRLDIASAIFRNVAVLVVPDSSLFIAPLKFQIHAILGYPVIAALGELTLHRGGGIEVRRSRQEALAPDANLYMEGSTPLVAATVDRQIALYRFDSGASGSVLTQRFCVAHELATRALARTTYGMAGAGGSRALPAVLIPDVAIRIGEVTSLLHNVPALTIPIGTELDLAFGNLGQDLIGAFESYSFDFSRMRFTLGTLRDSRRR